jgi:Flp pilus assembly protein TadB
MHKVTYDPRSGRPIAPVWWRLTPFFVSYAWLMAAVMMFFAYLGMRDGHWKTSTAAGAAGVFILLFVYNERRRVGRERTAFKETVAAYERAITTHV